jgi:hypothetical protein
LQYRVRQGLLRFRRPGHYKVSELPSVDSRLGLTLPDLDLLTPGLFRLAEALECIGAQLGNHNDCEFALKATLLMNHVQKKYKHVFGHDHFWNARIPGWLGNIVLNRLNKESGKSKYHYAGLDALEKAFTSIPLVKKFYGN